MEFQCEDINECSSQCLNTCDYEVSVCVNLNGSYECKCKKGYEKSTNDQNSQCIDVDECALLIEHSHSPNHHDHMCDKNALCLNLNGNYECRCIRGFYGNGTFCEGKWKI